MHQRSRDLASQGEPEKAQAAHRVAVRGQALAASLKRAVKVGGLVPAIAAAPVAFTAAHPSVDGAMGAGITLVSAAVFARHQNKRTAPADQRTAADRQVMDQAMAYTATRDVPALTRRAQAEIERSLDAHGSSMDADYLRTWVRAVAQDRTVTAA